MSIAAESPHRGKTRVMGKKNWMEKTLFPPFRCQSKWVILIGAAPLRQLPPALVLISRRLLESLNETNNPKVGRILKSNSVVQNTQNLLGVQRQSWAWSELGVPGFEPRTAEWSAFWCKLDVASLKAMPLILLGSARIRTQDSGTNSSESFLKPPILAKSFPGIDAKAIEDLATKDGILKTVLSSFSDSFSVVFELSLYCQTLKI